MKRRDFVCWANDCVCDAACSGAAAGKGETHNIGSFRDQGQQYEG